MTSRYRSEPNTPPTSGGGPFATDARREFWSSIGLQEVLERDGVLPAISEINVVAEDITLLEIRPAKSNRLANPAATGLSATTTSMRSCEITCTFRGLTLTNTTVLGSGFGALTTVRELRKQGVNCEITVISSP